MLTEFQDSIDEPGTVGAGVRAVTDPGLSSFDSTAHPPYVTVPVGSKRRVSLESTIGPPERIDVSVGSVASAKYEVGVTAQDFLAGEPVGPAITGSDVVIAGTGHGTTLLTAIVPLQTWGVAQLEVDVIQRRPILVNFHFVTDKQNKKTWYDAAKVQTVLSDVNEIYREANIEFSLNRHRPITVNIDFAQKNQSAAQIGGIWQTLWKLSRGFDNSPKHLNVWCVQEWGASDVPGQDVRGQAWQAEGICIVEDENGWAAQAHNLAHELGHALGLSHNPTEGALMHPTTNKGGKKLFKDEYRRIVIL
jgi:hypothetical protein